MKIVCLGDSITYGYGVRRGKDWVSRTADATGLELVNSGINGDTTGGMLARFQADVLMQNPEAVIIMGGSNDILTSGTDKNARSNMASMIQRALTAGILPIVGIPMPMDVPRVRSDWSELTDFAAADRILHTYANWVRKYCAIFKTPIVDFAGLFENAGSAFTTLYSDGLHPNVAGHAAMAELVCRRFNKLGIAKKK